MKLLDIFEKIKRKYYTKVINNCIDNNKELPNKIKVVILKRAIEHLSVHKFMCTAIKHTINCYIGFYITSGTVKILIPKFNRDNFNIYTMKNDFPIHGCRIDDAIWTIGEEPRIAFLKHLIKEYGANK